MIKEVMGAIFLVIVLCLSIKTFEDRGNKFTAIHLISQSQFAVRENGKLIDRKDTVLICYYEDLVMYREKYYYIKYNDKAIKEDTILASNDIKTIDVRESRFDYYIWKINSLQGVKYAGDNSSPSIINVDSLKVRKMFKRAKFYNIDFDKLIERRYYENNSSFVEKYANVSKPDDSYCDTTYYNFSNNFYDVPYSLSKTADSIKKSKLVGVRYIYNSVKNGITENIDLPRREMVFKVERTNSVKLSDIEKITARFQTDFKKNNLN